MDHLHEIFMAEASEMVGDLEKGLLQLESDPTNIEGISKVFRCMHTLKGSAGMFGFDSIGELTHHLETVYDSIRNGERTLSSEILKVTFESLDHLQNLLTDPKMKASKIQHTHASLLTDIQKLANDVASDQSKPALTAQRIESVTTCYYVSFYPNENVLQHGTNTLYLVEDLLSLGKGIALPHFRELPPFDELNPPLNYTCFEIILETSKSETDIREVFMFVESECLLEIRAFPIVDASFIEDRLQLILAKHKNNSPLGYDAVRNLLTSVVGEQIKGEKIIKHDLQQKKASNGSSVRVSSDRLDELMNLVSELVTTQARLSLFSTQNNSGELITISENVEKITRRLRDTAFTMSLIPIESLVVRFQRLVRDLSKELHKEVVFRAEGTETEIDKSVIEKLTDPLLHILRNSLDHGIENKADRASRGKPVQGTVLLRAYYSGSNVVIEIIDDGAGINLEKVKRKAIAKGLIEATAQLDEKEILNLIFLPGFSTADKITGVSGRGVGMDVVKRNVSDIRGEVDVTTAEGKGTTFTIKLPLTLSIIDGLLVRIGETDFILPLSSVNKCYEVETKILNETFNQWVTLEGERTPFLFLRKDFNIDYEAPALSQVIKITYEGKNIGLAVDKIIGEYQAVLKPLSEQYKDQDEFSGATILGDGSVALVLDPNKLIKKLVSDHQLNLKTNNS
jgi:two-component system chemotaxis sensor kinase CheA